MFCTCSLFCTCLFVVCVPNLLVFRSFHSQDPSLVPSSMHMYAWVYTHAHMDINACVYPQAHSQTTMHHLVLKGKKYNF